MAITWRVVRISIEARHLNSAPDELRVAVGEEIAFDVRCFDESLLEASIRIIFQESPIQATPRRIWRALVGGGRHPDRTIVPIGEANKPGEYKYSVTLRATDREGRETEEYVDPYIVVT